jgi:hypothetical protein
MRSGLAPWGLLALIALSTRPMAFAAGRQAISGSPVAAVAHDANAALPDAPDAPPDSAGQETATPQSTTDALTGSIHGTVVDGSAAVAQGAHVALVWTPQAGGPPVARETTTDSNGEFSFSIVAAGTFTLTVSSKGFTTRTVSGTIHDGESVEAPAVTLVMNGTTTDVEVSASPVEIAEAQLKEEETQRVLGVIPNFYVTYVHDAPPLTRKQKYQLAWRSSIDPVNFGIVGILAGVEQATDSFSGYGQGAQGYAKRYGAGYTDSFDATFIGGAVLASWWKQDPRYFYKGTGSKQSRIWYAIAMAVVCKGDNGRWQPNYSGIVGGLAAGGISNLYYPASNREGASLTFENAGLGTAGSAVGNLFQEFVVKHLTPHVPDYGAGKQ